MAARESVRHLRTAGAFPDSLPSSLLAIDLSTTELNQQFGKFQPVFLSHAGCNSAGTDGQLSHLRHDPQHEHGDLRAALAVRVCPVAKASCRA